VGVCTGMFDKFISRAQYRQAFLLSFIIISIYCLVNFVLGRIFGSFWGNYGIPALLWAGVAFIVYKLPSRRAAAKLRFRKMFCWLAFLSAVAGIMAVYAGGLLEGFGKSPYDLSFRGILVNIFYLGFMVVGMEMSRAWFLNVFFRRRPVTGVVLTSLVFSFFWFSLNRVVDITEGLEAVKFIGSIYFPALSENVLASYLAFWGGALPAIIYRGTLLAFRWFLPVLPDLNWITLALVGTFAPAFALILSHQLYTGESSRSRRKSGDAGSPLGWFMTSGACVLIIWFSVGVFSYFPTAIVSGSMSPEIGVGDVVIVKREPAGAIEVGDVIQFRDGDLRIAHRVVEIEEDGAGGKVFWTKGDANKNRDADPVLPEQLIGKVVFKIPKVGWVTIWARSRGG
jgi:signal peptidase